MPVAAEVLAMFLGIIKAGLASRAFELEREIALLPVLLSVLRNVRVARRLGIALTLRHRALVFLCALRRLLAILSVSNSVTRTKEAVRSVRSGNRLSSEDVAGDLVLLAELIDCFVLSRIDEEFARFRGLGVNHLLGRANLLHLKKRIDGVRD